MAKVGFIASAAVRVISRTLSACLWLLVAASVAILLIIGIGPRSGSYRTITVLSGSMRPVIMPGSVVIVVPIPTSEVRVGDVITFMAPVDGSPMVTHRVIQIATTGTHPVIRTKGDANTGPDPWLARMNGDTAWRVRFSIPAAGYGINWLRQPAAHKLTVVLTPILLAVALLVGIWRTPGNEAPESDPIVSGAVR